MRKISRSSVVACSLLAAVAMMPTRPAISQKRTPAVAGRQYVPAKPENPKTQYVQPPAQQPILSLAASSQHIQPNQNVRLMMTWNLPMSRMQYQIDWGDGPPAATTDTTADHVYAAPATYTVRVTASPPEGVESFENIAPAQITITVEAPAQPTVTLTADKVRVEVGEAVTFTATLTPVSSDAQYHFDFGDGPEQFSLSNQITHTYTNARTFTANVTALINDGGVSATSPSLEIGVIPVPSQKKRPYLVRPGIIQEPPIWPRIAAWTAVVGVPGLILCLILLRRPSRSAGLSSQAPNREAKPNAQPKFRFVPRQGLERHEFTTKRFRSLGSMTMHIGVDRAEHRIKFRR